MLLSPQRWHKKDCLNIHIFKTPALVKGPEGVEVKESNQNFDALEQQSKI